MPMAMTAVPTMYLMVGGGIPVLIIAVFVWYFMDMKKYAPEAYIFRKARKDGIPVLDITDLGTGDSEMMLGTKDQKDDIYYDIGMYGTKLDPAMTTGDCQPSRYKHGLTIYHDSTTGFLPLGAPQARAFQQINDLLRGGKYQILDFLTTEDVHQLFDTPRDEWNDDIRNFITEREPEGSMEAITETPDIRDGTWKAIEWIPDTELERLVRLPEDAAYRRIRALVGRASPTNDGHPLTSETVMIELGQLRELVGDEHVEIVESFVEAVLEALTHLQEESSVQPLSAGPFSYAAAHRDNPNAYSAQDVQHFELNILRKAQLLYQKFEKWMQYAIILGGLAIVGAVAFAIIVSVGGK